MDTDRYAPPKAELNTAPAAPNEAKVPPEVLQKIRNAWITCLIALAITLLLSVIALSGLSSAGYSAWHLIDVVLVAGLAFGIYRKSRACAVVMFVYFLISRILTAVETGHVRRLLVGAVFLYFYWQGVVGTFAYHRHVNG